MFDMYQGFAFYKNWDFEVLNYTPAEYGTSFPSVFQSHAEKGLLSCIILVSVVAKVGILSTKSQICNTLKTLELY